MRRGAVRDGHAHGRSVPVEDGAADGATIAFRADLGMAFTFYLTFDGDAVEGAMKAASMPETQLSGTRR